MEAYLPRCLDSVTRKDVPDTLEVIVVNDGSKDRSLEIAKEYQAQRPDIISIIDKPNGHYGSCINAALKIATGKYFRPLDADDWFDTDGLIVFLQKLESTDVDLAITNYKCHRKTNTSILKMDGGKYEQPYTNDVDILRNQKSAFLSMHAFTYKLSILKQVGLTLSEGINYSDSEYMFYPLHVIKTFLFFDLILYNYNLTRDDQSMNPVVAAKNHSQFATIIRKILSVSYNYSLLERKVLCTCIGSYYYRLLFYCAADSELKSIDRLLQQKDPVLRDMVNKDLMYAPGVWRLTGIHFFWYEKLKKFFKIDR